MSLAIFVKAGLVPGLFFLAVFAILFPAVLVARVAPPCAALLPRVVFAVIFGRLSPCLGILAVLAPVTFTCNRSHQP